MSEVRGVVVAHGDLARCLVETAESIAGVSGALVPISNVERSPAELSSRIREAVGRGPAIVFVDLVSGSCAHAARSAAREGADVSVICGVSLAILLDFMFHSDMELIELSERLIEKGHAGTSAFLPDSP